MKPVREIMPFPLRLQDNLKDWVKDRAKKRGNSVNTEISILLTAVKGQMERPQKKHNA